MASLNSCRRPCASGTAVELEAGERAAKQGEEVFWSVWAHRLCWEEEVRYKEKEMSPQPRGADLKPALSFPVARVTAAHLCCRGFRCSADVSAHFCAKCCFLWGFVL